MLIIRQQKMVVFIKRNSFYTDQDLAQTLNFHRKTEMT